MAAAPDPRPARAATALPVPARFDATRATGALLVEHCDIPEGMTLGEWRRSAAVPRRTAGGLRRALRLA